MNAVIFIRTYPKDYEWLRYCLRSIAKHAPGVKTMVTTSDPRFFATPEAMPRGAWWRMAAREHADDYVGQQLTKLNADLYLPEGFDHVIHIDSDTTLIGSLDKLFVDGKPVMLRTPYSELPPEVPWKAPTEKHLGWGVSHEYMRRMPLVYPFGLYAALRQHLIARAGSWPGWVDSIEGRNLSEFNLLGAFAFEHFHNSFHWVDTNIDPLPPLIVNQLWSWGGIEKHRAQLEKDFPSV